VGIGAAFLKQELAFLLKIEFFKLKTFGYSNFFRFFVFFSPVKTNKRVLRKRKDFSFSFFFEKTEDKYYSRTIPTMKENQFLPFSPFQKTMYYKCTINIYIYHPLNQLISMNLKLELAW
jgi:hypothetical protein